MLNQIFTSSSNCIQAQVNAWNAFSRFPLKGEMWEERLSLGFSDAGYENDWEPDGNHTPGVDFSLDDEELSFSCKSGKLKNGVLSISSYRTTKFKTLKEKLDYHESKKAKPFTHYAILVRDEDNGKQHCLFIEKSYINAKTLNWSETYAVKGKNAGQHNGWSGTSGKINMKIQKSMSDQFWYYLDWAALTKSPKAEVLFSI